ncbi:mannuronate-specific alginate lyase [Phytobacter sp. V91]|uniref:mannuronate-specific alginate lyase n=1 Tax=Phytobacter sp. V91 TaxID=3369425 RepID=UPI003F641C20
MFSLLRVFLLLLIAVSTAQAKQALVPPPGYLRPPASTPASPSRFRCPDFPAPFTAALQFSSKYAGSDGARATLNPVSEQDFHQQTSAITTLEKQVSQLVIGYERDGDPARVACVVKGLAGWAQADALSATDTNHTGRSMRKWALASLSSAWLQLQYSPQQPLKARAAPSERIERWLGQLADLVVADWSTLPLEKTNNHSYWAAWAIMATSVVTQRESLFQHALAIYRTAAYQVDKDGFLPNELRRRQRALAYHNYALQPLVMIALFARSNGVEVTKENHNALARLAELTIAGLHDPQAFRQKTGSQQDLAFSHQPTNLAWLEGWCALEHCPESLDAFRQQQRPLRNTRLGGDLSRLFATP